MADAQENIVPIAKMIKEKMTAAVESFKAGQAADGALLLLDTIKITRPEEAWPEGFLEHINSAEKAYKDNDLVCATAEVKRSLEILKPENTITDTKEKGEISNLTEAFLAKINAAENFFSRGLADQAVVTILEALLLLSPIE